MKVEKNKQYLSLKKKCFFWITLSSIFIFSGCLPGLETDDGRSGRPLIEDFSASTTTEEGECKDGTGRDIEDAFIDLTFETCLDTCADNQHIASTDEINEIIEEISTTTGLTEDEENTLLELINGSQGLCIDNITRPSGKIDITSDFCGCLNSDAIILNNCASYCNGKNTTDNELLFVNVKLDPEIEQNAELGSLQNWCTKEIDDGNTNPSCMLELFDGNGYQNLPITDFTGTTSFSLNIKSLPVDKTFVARIVEQTSGASSGSFQIRKIDPTEEETFSGPLSIHPVSQYTCISRSGNSDGANFYWTNSIRLHFYYSPNDPPPSLPPITRGQVFCHDINLYGINDSPLFDRLELIPQHFAIWNYRDTRFVDTDGNEKEDINDILQQRLLDEYSISKEVKIFGTFKWPNVIPVSESGTDGSAEGESSSTETPITGYFMIPWVNSTTGQGFCPTQEHYNGTDPMFKVMKDYIGVDTEGIYLGEREALSMFDSDGALVKAPTDVIIIRETLLKKIWFYYENNQHLEPDDFSASNKTIMFYWPPDIYDPYVRKSSQYIYTIRAAEDIGSGEANGSTDLQTSIRPPDKRFGCVPSLGEVTENPLDN